ncbi:piggyBac transposable element-derived protein 4 [Ctenocephalides felis]|uniref:piggyBac transposable element-derived protein 4 n=1 Tax=Ctenocephalides felis TaxID=7515 RepID=UPI000E6E2BF1|nr:piggyBac transposable element-derived protein 4 [Ctenocephalides felis]
MASGEKIYNLEKPAHAEEILRMLNDDADENNLLDDLGDESGSDEDHLESREVDSETEQEDEQDESVIGNAKNAATPIECWSLFFTDEMLNIILTYTNQYIEEVKVKYERERDTKPIDSIELKAFIGLLFLAGVYKANRLCLEELWGINGDGVEKFHLVMSIKRFKFIMRCLRFDDRLTRYERKQEDRLAAVREIFTQFVHNCKKNYSLGEYVTVDEKLEAFRGRCPFRQYIPSKPAKYGIKIFALVDAKLCYTYNLEIYAGQQPNGPFQNSNKPSDVIRRLIQPILGSGRNLTADNWFTEFDLVEELRQNKISYVGTVRKNKKQLPPEFITSIGRKEYSSIFGFMPCTTLVSYVPKKGKTVILVSTLHEDKSVNIETGYKTKPNIITFYNETKGGVDTVDKMCESFNVARNVRRWPMVIFFAMLNMSGINAQIIYHGNGKKDLRRRYFLRQLSHELVLGQLTRRSEITSGIPFTLQAGLKRFRPNSQENVSQKQDEPQKKRRCEPCTLEANIRRLSRFCCAKCRKALCLQHAIFQCSACSNASINDNI